MNILFTQKYSGVVRTYLYLANAQTQANSSKYLGIHEREVLERHDAASLRTGNTVSNQRPPGQDRKACL